MYFRSIVISIILVLFMSGDFIVSADDMDNIFGELENKASEQKEEEAKGKDSIWSQILNNMERTLFLNATRYRYNHTERGPMQTNRHLWFANLDVTTKAIRGDNLFYMQLWLEQSNLDAAYHHNFQLERDQGKKRRNVQFNQFYYTRSFDSFDLTFGKKMIESGVSEIFSPADRFNRADVIPEGKLDREEGVWLAEYSLYKGSNIFKFSILPVFEQSREISKHSRWTLTPSVQEITENPGFLNFTDVNSGNAPKDVEEEFPEASFDNIQLKGTYKTTFKGWDFFVTGFHGYSPYFLLKDEGDFYVRKYVKAFDLMGGFSTTWKKWKFYGETVSRIVYEDKDDDTIETVFGATYTIDDLAKKIHLQKIDLTAEYSWEHIIDDYSNDNYISSSRKARQGRDNAYFKADLKYSEDLYFMAGWAMDWYLESDTWTLGFSNRFNENITLKMWTEIYGASDNSPVRNIIDNDRYCAQLEIKF